MNANQARHDFEPAADHAQACDGAIRSQARAGRSGKLLAFEPALEAPGRSADPRPSTTGRTPQPPSADAPPPGHNSPPDTPILRYAATGSGARHDDEIR